MSHAGGSEQVMSADGRFVAFVSYGPNLVAGQVDTSDTPDVFLFDRRADAGVLPG